MCTNHTYSNSNVEQGSSFTQRVRGEYPRTEEDYKTHFKAVSERASRQWKAMSDAEKAVRAIMLR